MRLAVEDPTRLGFLLLRLLLLRLTVEADEVGASADFSVVVLGFPYEGATFPGGNQ